MNKKIKKYIIILSKFINYHNYRYYILNKPKISNYEFDNKFNLLIKLENKYNYFYKYSPTKKLNNNLFLKKFKIIKHIYKMYSIKNVYNKEEFLKWKNNIDKKINKKNDYICELKYDGIAISIIYKYGKLNNAITRGDGIYGNIVINNILYIKNIPKYIKKIKNIKFFDIKGEIVFSNKNFIIINNYQKKNGEKLFSNPRSAVNGIIHNNKKNNIYIKKKLDFIPYYIYTNNNNYNIKINNQFKTIKFLEYLYFNFKKKSYKLCKNNKEIINYINYWEKNKYNSLYPIDGIVIKLNNFNIKNKLKYNNIFHKWCIAYKFKDKNFITKIIKIYFYIGKTGIIVPVVYFKSIIINGTNIKKASLYNSNIFNKYKLSFNDKIIIKKSGNIIPKIVKNLNYKKKIKNYKYINFPLYCPSCNNFLKKKNKIYYCNNNEKCKKQIIEKIKHFLSKEAMNIKINKNIINKLFLYKKLNNLSDLFFLKKKDFKKIKITDNEINRILNEINLSKKNKKFYNILFSLCIPNIGKYISKKINKKYKNFNTLLNDIKNKKIKYNNFGKKNIYNIKKFFKKKKNILILKKLKKIGLNI
ncbi:MAG: NAD-dependent DNA ligase LigA [Candidatus Shikimatogenerans bostrichidophilus]|nr:MAG: NAD-dependent DNA ligase LigA [Candidatus Shikimatogenerans bostrichidophilus]